MKSATQWKLMIKNENPPADDEIKKKVAYPSSRMLLGNKKGWSADSYYNMLES